MTDQRIARRGWQYWQKMNCESCFHPATDHMDEGGSFISCGKTVSTYAPLNSPLRSRSESMCLCASFQWYTWDGIKLPYYRSK
jgi:hypothetical protein